MSLPHIPVLLCDNNSAIALASNPVFHSRTKHIEVDYHYVRECVLHRDLDIKFISGCDNFADIFTKSLPGPHFVFLRSKLLTDSTQSLRGDVEISTDKSAIEKPLSQRLVFQSQEQSHSNG